MPNHSSGKGKRKSYQQPSAEERYANLELAKQLACYRYLTHIEQGRNTKLWNPNKTPTSVWNWRSSNYIKEHIEEGSWAKVAKVMATLAKELAARGKRLVDPLQAAAAKAKKTGLTFDDCKENFCFDREEEKEGSTTSPKKKAAIHTSGKFSSPSGNFSSQSARPVSRQEYLKSLDSSKKTALKSPPLTQQVTPRMDRLTQAANHLSLEDGSHVEIVGSAYATIIGTWDDQNVDEDDTDSSGSDDEFEDEVFTMIRMIMPNGITEKLLTPEWLDDQTLQLTIRWPTWFRKVSKHVALQKSETNAKFKFGKNHKVFRTMRRYVRNLYKRDPSTGLKVSPKVIEDTILFKFNSSMDTTADAIQVKVVKIAIGKDDIDAAAGEEIPTGGKVSVLQVIVSAKINEKNEVAKKIKVSGEEANLGKEPDGTKAFDSDYYDRFTSLYDDYDISPPSQEDLRKYSGVEENLYYLTSRIIEDDQDLLDEDFVEQVMNQYIGRPAEMMEYVERELLDRQKPPQIAYGSPAVVEDDSGGSMDVTDRAKRKKNNTLTNIKLLSLPS